MKDYPVKVKNRNPLKKAILEIIYLLLSLFGTAFADRKFPVRILLRQVFAQKILGFNRHVSWPVHWTSQVRAVHNIERGTRFPGLALGCYLDGRNGIKIGRNTWIGPKVSIISMNHNILDYYKFVEDDPIVIGDNCWIATGATILPGVKLGNHVVVAAGAVVTKSFMEDDILLAGVPARIVKGLDPYEKNHLNVLSTDEVDL